MCIRDRSKELLQEQQAADEVVGSIIRFLFPTGQELPEEEIEASILRGLGPEVQHLYAQRQSLRMLDGVLYRRYERADGTLQHNQVVVPRTLREEFLRASHAGLINGHFGIEKSRERLRQLAYWQGWTEDVKMFVNRCNLCNQYRHGPRGKSGQMQPSAACAPMQKVHIDLTGPHVLSSNGYKYILTAVSYTHLTLPTILRV